jgi:hypothetical protein
MIVVSGNYRKPVADICSPRERRSVGLRRDGDATIYQRCFGFWGGGTFWRWPPNEGYREIGGRRSAIGGPGLKLYAIARLFNRNELAIADINGHLDLVELFVERRLPGSTEECPKHVEDGGRLQPQDAITTKKPALKAELRRSAMV